MRKILYTTNGSLISRNTAYLEALGSKGFHIEKSKMEDFIHFLGKAYDNHWNRVICGEEEAMLFPSRTGWLDNDKPFYILPNEVIPPNPKIIPNIAEMKKVYSRKGRREEWMKIPKYAVKNPPYTFGICLALAGVLLPFSGIDTGTIFHPVNESTAGKTLMGHILASVWGSDRDQRAAWDATVNNAASLGCSRNHNTLYLDEIGQSDGKDVGRIVFTLANGRGRGKNDRNDHAKEPKTWKCFILSNGNATLNAVMKEAGKGGATGGQNVRFVPIRIVKSMYGSLHGFATGDAIGREICFITERNYGWAGPDFVKWVAEHYEMVKEYVPEAMPKIIDSLIPEGSHDQIRRTAQAFALLVIAGKVAQRCGILPEEIDVFKDIKTMCDAWLAGRSSVGKSFEAESIVANVRYSLTTYSAKFMEAEKGKAVGGLVIQEKLGYKERKDLANGDAAYHFYIDKEHICRIAQYENLDAVVAALDDAGMLYATPTQKKKKVKSRDKMVQKNFEGIVKQRYYEIILRDDIDESGDDDGGEPEAVEEVDPVTGEVTMDAKPSADGTAKAS